MGYFQKLASNFADRMAYGFGSQAALGRLTLAAATNTLMAGWKRYAGRKGISQPTVGDLLHFLQIEHGIEIPPDAVATIFGGTTAVRVNIEAIMPRIADILIDDGLIDVEWGQQ